MRGWVSIVGVGEGRRGERWLWKGGSEIGIGIGVLSALGRILDLRRRRRSRGGGRSRRGGGGRGGRTSLGLAHRG